MIALSIEVLVEMIHKSAVVLDTKDRETSIMKRVSEVRTPGITIFNKLTNFLKKIILTATLSFFLLLLSDGGEVGLLRCCCWVRSLAIKATSVATVPIIATFFALP